MKSFINNNLLIFLILLFFCKNAFSENNQTLNLLSICADKNYINLDVEDIDKMTYEDNQNYIILKNKLDNLIKRKNQIANKYVSEREKFVAEFPEPSSDSYSKNQWEQRMAWERRKSEKLSPFINNLDEIINEISKFQEIINKDIKKLSLNYLEKKTIYEKSKNVVGYINSVQECENEYENYPITFKLKWS